MGIFYSQEILCASAVENSTVTIDSYKERVVDAIKRLEAYNIDGESKAATEYAATKESTSKSINATLDKIEVRSVECLSCLVYDSNIFLLLL